MAALTGVGEGNFAGLVGVNPDTGLSALEDGGGKPPLESHGRHNLYSFIIIQPGEAALRPTGLFKQIDSNGD